METVKKRWDFVVSDTAKAIQLIQEFLRINNYNQYSTNGVIWYQFIDRVLIGKACFEYYINTNQIPIFAYLGDYNNPTTLDHTIIGWSNSPGKMKYLSMLEVLFNNLNQLSINEQSNINEVQFQQQQSTINNYEQHQYIQSQPQNMSNMQNQLNSNNDKFAIIALVASILNLICACLGVVFGIFIQILVYVFAAIGLKSNKKAAAVVAMIINSIALVISIIMIIISVMA